MSEPDQYIDSKSTLVRMFNVHAKSSVGWRSSRALVTRVQCNVVPPAVRQHTFNPVRRIALNLVLTEQDVARPCNGLVRSQFPPGAEGEDVVLGRLLPHPSNVFVLLQWRQEI